MEIARQPGDLMDQKKNIAIVGATGYTGQELVRLLLSHPQVKIAALTSRTNAGESYARYFPQFRGYDLPPISEYHPEELAGEVDLVFFCLPHGESQESVAAAVDLGLKAVDFSADFRLRKLADYRRWYGDHVRPEMLKTSVYGLPEIHRAAIVGARLVSVPGCYPTGVILGVAPLLRAKLADPSHIIADLKSGVSGAGRKAAVEYSFCELHDDFRPYNLYAHRHTSEMEQELGIAAGKKTRVTFSPHLVPMSRGILGTIYLNLARKSSAKELQAVIAEAYEHEPFVRVLPLGDLPAVSRVRGSNFVDLAVVCAPSGREAIVASAIDNLVKGAAGAAVQNMNLMLGLPETAGLLAPPLRP
jgi:N-acetyl-gamma-glutamyl-phosphate reductase